MPLPQQNVSPAGVDLIDAAARRVERQARGRRERADPAGWVAGADGQDARLAAGQLQIGPGSLPAAARIAMSFACAWPTALAKRLRLIGRRRDHSTTAAGRSPRSARRRPRPRALVDARGVVVELERRELARAGVVGRANRDDLQLRPGAEDAVAGAAGDRGVDRAVQQRVDVVADAAVQRGRGDKPGRGVGRRVDAACRRGTAPWRRGPAAARRRGTPRWRLRPGVVIGGDAAPRGSRRQLSSSAASTSAASGPRACGLVEVRISGPASF